MVTKDLGVTHDEMLAEVAAAVERDIPGPEWVTIAETAIALDITRSAAAYRLEKQCELGIMESRKFGIKRHYRMVKDDE